MKNCVLYSNDNLYFVNKKEKIIPDSKILEFLMLSTCVEKK